MTVYIPIWLVYLLGGIAAAAVIFLALVGLITLKEFYKHEDKDWWR